MPSRPRFYATAIMAQQAAGVELAVLVQDVSNCFQFLRCIQIRAWQNTKYHLSKNCRGKAEAADKTARGCRRIFLW